MYLIQKYHHHCFMTNIVRFPKKFLFMKIPQPPLHIDMVYLYLFVLLGATKGLIPNVLKD